jgi:predicted ATPase
MSAGRWQRLQEIFAEAQERPESERAVFLDIACDDDVDLRREVISLLAASGAPSALDRVAEQWAGPLLRDLRPAPVPGSTLGGYVVVRELGRGGMGIVYHARDPRLARDVAIKVLAPIRPGAGNDSGLLSEARAASALDHPNICAVHHAGEDEHGRLFIVMPLYLGETLQRRLSRGPLPLAEAVSIAIRIAAGLGAAHASGIVHRDVKPANVILTPDGGLRILDFGIASLRRGLEGTLPAATAGTLAYMAPEQLRGEEADERADLWALGVLLYEMAAGRRLFGSETEGELIREILHCDPEPLFEVRPGAPPSLDRIVTRLLARDREERFEDAGSARAALERVRAELSATVRASLPLPLTPLVGREAELEQVSTLLRGCRLLTLTGTAGAGKTRLAVESAHRLALRFPDGCRFVDLANLREAEQVIPAIAHALGIPDLPGIPPLDRLQQVMQDRSLLLVLDNFEQVASAAGEVRALLGLCEGLRVVVTSRAPLHVEGEQEMPLSALPVPDASTLDDPQRLLASDAVRLFVDRARAVRPDFQLGPDNARSVGELCVRLDGLPLAIELAAARTRIFSPQSLLRRLEERIDVLSQERGDRPDRHRTLRQSIEWSYDLLDARTQRVFRSLAVFRGGFTLEAAEAVCASGSDPVPAIEALLDHSLIQRRDEGAEPRFRLLETLRAFAGECLQENEEQADVQRCHAAYMAGLAEAMEPSLTGPAQVEGFDRLAVEHENLQAALTWGKEQDPVVAMRLCAALWRFWVARGHLREARSWLEHVVTRGAEQADPILRARALSGAATVSHNHGDNQRARIWLQEALALHRGAGDRPGIAATLNHLSWVACETTRLERATALAEEALRLCGELADRRGQAVARNNLGWVAAYRGDGRDALRHHAAGLRIRRDIGDQRGAAYALINMAVAERLCGEHARAIELLDEADRILEQIQDPLLRGWSLVNRGIVERDRGDDVTATRHLEEALRRWPEMANRSVRAVLLMELGEIHIRTGGREEGERMIQEALREWRAIDCPWGADRALALLQGKAPPGAP